MMKNKMQAKNSLMVSEALTYRCPKCKQVWLLIEATEDAVHQCVVCGRSFVVNQTTRLNGRSKLTPQHETQK